MVKNKFVKVRILEQNRFFFVYQAQLKQGSLRKKKQIVSYKTRVCYLHNNLCHLQIVSNKKKH